MDASSVSAGLIRWLETFPGVSGVTVEGLSDGVVMGRVLCIIDSSHFTSLWLSRLKEDCGDNWRLKVSNLRKIQQSVVDYLQYLNVQYAGQSLPDLTTIGEKCCPHETGRMLQLIVGCAMNCHDKERYIQSIMVMPADVQGVVMQTLQTVFMRDTSPGAEVTGPASFHPNHRTIAEQLESTTKARDEAVARVHELESQYADVCEKRQELTDENSRLIERLEGLEDIGEGSTGTASRYKDLKKKIDSLQDDLFKVETSRDEYRSRVEQLQREHSDMVSRTEELQRLADQAHTLQDEVDVLRDMGHRASQAETTIESYKKKLEELSDLRRQHKILEEKNADYMQHIIELEEDVKKNDSWRPQLELFKKEVAELRHQLTEETKKADRQAFDNKKLTEKIEAITVEKDRIAVEREGLKEQLDELRCQRSAKMTEAGGDINTDLLSTDQHLMWEKLMRVQHENQQLKKRQGEADPVMQAMYSQLKEQDEATTVENRWAAGRDSVVSPPPAPSLQYPIRTPTPDTLHQTPLSCSPSMGSRSSSMAFFDAYVNLDTPRKLRMFRRNLKWASESDLLILRQPSLFTNLFSSFTGKSYSPGKSPPSSTNDIDDRTLALSKSLSRPDRPRPYSDGSQQHIVIRHIHEFKVSSSGPASNEDSGCCRTSPSSCEGCEDGPGTLDSGVGMCGTIDSGLSSLYECVSPMIPAIVEDCSSRHLSDMLSGSSQGPTSLTSNYSSMSSGSSSIMQHHTHCCSAHTSNNALCQKRSHSRRRGESVSPTRMSRSREYFVNKSSNSSANSMGSDGKTLSTSGVSSTCSSPARRPIGRNPLPPDSPTPHNSPRIPTRITATRNRSSRSSKSPSHSSYSSTSESEPLVTHRHVLRRSQSQTDKPRMTLSEKIKHVNRNCISSSNESLRSIKRSPTPDADYRSRQIEVHKNNYNTKESLTYSAKPSNLIKCQSSISADSIPLRKEEEIKVCQSINGLEISPRLRGRNSSGVSSKPVSVVRGVASAFRYPTSCNVSSISNPNINSASGNENRTTVTGNRQINFENRVIGNNSNEKEKRLKSNKRLQNNGAQITERANNSKGSMADSSSQFDSRQSGSSKKSLTPPLPSRGSFNLETHFGMHDMSDDGEPVTVLRPTTSKTSLKSTRVSFKQPIRMTIDIPNSSSLSSSLEKPNTKLTPFRRSASMRVTNTSTPKNSKQDVTMLKSDTLFTNFVVSPKKASGAPTETVPSSRRFQHYPLLKHAPAISAKNKALLLPYIETDSDEDVLEHRLVAGAYSAPLVSSESCTSVSHDDYFNDTDPCATEYNTDNGSDTYDFTPHLFRLNYDELQNDEQIHLIKQKYPQDISLVQQKLQVSPPANFNSPGKVLRRNSLSRIQEEESVFTKGASPRVLGGSVSPYNKLAKQDKFLKSTSYSGVKKKKKHKTAKMVAAETFNAMFTFCTP